MRPITVGLLALLASCTALPQSKVTQISQDVQLISAGLSAALPQVQGIPATNLADAEMVLADLKTVAATISTAASTQAAQVDVREVETDVNTVVSALAGLPLPPAVATALQAAQVLLPVLEVAAGIPASATAPAKGLTPDGARLALRAVAAQ